MNQIQVVTVGEGLLVLRAPNCGILERSHRLEVLVGGAEINVAVGLARLGVPSAWMSRLPNNPISRNIASQIQGVGVDVSGIKWVPYGRIGIMYSELGVPPRANQVVYDRANSTASEMSIEDLDWDTIANAKVLHTTGITAGISETARATTIGMCKRAHDSGIKVSFDVNFRAKVSPPEEASAVISEIAPYVDILITGDEEARNLMGVPALTPEKMIKTIRDKYRVSVCVLTLGEKGSIAWDGTQFYHGSVYHVNRLNRFGAGDSFVAGFLYGYLKNDLQMGMNYGSAIAAYKMTLPNDNFPVIRKEEIERVIRTGRRLSGSSIDQSHASYRVER